MESIGEVEVAAEALPSEGSEKNRLSSRERSQTLTLDPFTAISHNPDPLSEDLDFLPDFQDISTAGGSSDRLSPVPVSVDSRFGVGLGVVSHTSGVLQLPVDTSTPHGEGGGGGLRHRDTSNQSTVIT